MSTTTDAAPPIDDAAAEPSSPAVVRRRRRLNAGAVTLIAVITASGGFYGGIQIEKSQGASAPTASTARRAPVGAAAGAGAACGASATTGTVTAVKGDTIELKTTDGTVTVQLPSTTTVSKAESVKSGQLRPGDSVVISGQTKSDGTIAASSVRDTS
jgi:hypothetical protein